MKMAWSCFKTGGREVRVYKSDMLYVCSYQPTAAVRLHVTVDLYDLPRLAHVDLIHATVCVTLLQ